MAQISAGNWASGHCCSLVLSSTLADAHTNIMHCQYSN